MLVATAAGFAVSFVLLERVIGGSSPWLGLLAMFYLLGLAKVAEPLFMLRMPARLRELRHWEKRGAVYRRLLVPGFGRLLRNTPLRHLNNDVYLAQKRPDLHGTCRRAEAAEAVHLLAAVAFTPYIAYLWLQGQAAIVALFLLVQVLVNIYPIMHLRIARGRLDRLLHKRIVRI